MKLSTKTPRIEVVDALRGFAVMAILLVHNLEHFIFPVYPESSPEWLTILDAGVFNATFSLLAGKSYAIFALLFGFTFYIQSHNQQLKGKDFGYRFLWRMILLAGFATLNAAFFPAGDVLLLFVVVSLVLFIVGKWSDTAILITAILFSLQPIEWFHYIMSLFNPAYTLPDLNVGAMYAEVAEYTKAGSFWDFLIGNVTLGQKDIQSVVYKLVCTPTVEEELTRTESIEEWRDEIAYFGSTELADLDEEMLNEVAELILLEQIKCYDWPKTYLEQWQEFRKKEMLV